MAEPAADVYCKHEVNVSVSRCVDCLDTRPRGYVHTEERQPVAGPERQAAEWKPTWAGARQSIADAQLPWSTPGEPGINDWQGMAELASIEEARDFGPWVQSQYRSPCKACGYRWEPGEMIRYSEDEQGWICSECGSA